MKIGKILVPLDGSPLAEAALGKAIELAKDSPGASITLIRAAEASPIGVDPIKAQIEVVHEAEEYLNGVAKRVRSEGVKSVEISVWYGPPAPSIVEAANVAHAAMIVMSTHGRSGLGRLLLGSVAESVLRATHLPILLLHPDGAPIARPAAASEARITKEPVHV